VLDLHSHILPGIDDGARDLGEARALAERAEADGVRTIAATPHLRSDHPRVDPEAIARQVEDLHGHLVAEGIGVELVSGAEVDSMWAYRASDRELQLASYGGRGTDLLLETPYGFLPPVFDDVVDALRERGMRILLAHPERSPTFQRDPDRLVALVHSGVLLQVSADSLADAPRRAPARRLATRLVRERLAHVLATDSHGPGVGRSPTLSAAVAVAERLAPGWGRWMTREAPAAVLAGIHLERPAVAEARRGTRR
jgi:protein-tyrosine phosphatase